MASPIQFTREDWDRIERDYAAWWAGELDRPLVYMAGRDRSVKLPAVNGFLANHPIDLPAEELCAKFDPILRAGRYYGDGFPHWFINFGAGVVAAFLGAKVNARPDTVWFEPAEPREMKDVHPAFDPQNVWWQRVLDVTRAACAYWDGNVAISHADLGGNLDVVASLRTTEGLLFDLVDAPDEVERVLWAVSPVWHRCYDELTPIIKSACRGTVPWSPIWSPRRAYMLQCDFCYMISPAMFERFVLPELAATCEFLDDAFYHLDGPGALPHLDMLLGIGSLKGIQWIPGAGNPDAARWPDVLRRIHAAGKLCQIWAAPEDAMKITREIGGKGFQFIVDGNMEPDEANSFLKDIERAGRRK